MCRGGVPACAGVAHVAHTLHSINGNWKQVISLQLFFCAVLDDFFSYDGGIYNKALGSCGNAGVCPGDGYVYGALAGFSYVQGGLTMQAAASGC